MPAGDGLADWSKKIWSRFPSSWPYLPHRKGECPHCGRGVQFLEPEAETFVWMGRFRAEATPRGGRHSEAEDAIGVASACCPICHSLVISMESAIRSTPWLLWPRVVSRGTMSADVPIEIARDYEEAASVLALSPRASAALSRRCLQSVLRSAGGVRPGSIYGEIEQVISDLPPYIAKNLHALRELGNFGVHPTRSEVTGEIVDVDPGEAEWVLHVLDLLLAHYYTLPGYDAERRQAISQKLEEAGRPPLPSEG